MINIIWASMAVIGIVYAAFTGNMAAVNKAIFQSADDAVALTIGLVSVLVFWLGIMKVAEQAGMLKMLAKVLSPIICRIFPEVPKDHPAMGYILSNITANLFGLGNAATPMGIKAMKELKNLSGSNEASRSMITFMAINTAGLTLIPSTVIAIRLKYGSASPTEIVGPTLLATIIGLTGALCLDRLFYYLDRRKSG